eukprot:GEMP01036960.1.p1 GENE.GEMP01036960.1~~GEMP01036960.1.p1  ORF type:complete len:434 (-),score=81.39 GEMP01036960.1:670-1971(-)
MASSFSDVPDPIQDFQVISSFPLLISWTPPRDNNLPINLYHWEGLKFDATTTETSIAVSLPPGVQLIRGRARNEEGWGEWAEFLVHAPVPIQVDSEAHWWGSGEDGKMASAGNETVQPFPIPCHSYACGSHTAVIYDDKLYVTGTLLGTEDEMLLDFEEVPLEEPAAFCEVGRYVTAVVTRRGNLYIWGPNNHHQCGFDTTERTIMVPRLLRRNVIRVALGELSGLLLDANSDCYAWGFQMGLNIDNMAPFPQPAPIKVAENVREVACGAFHCAFITDKRELFMWGQNSEGQLGLGHDQDHFTPVKVRGDVDDVSLGAQHSACWTGGSCWTWGSNRKGQLGIGSDAGDKSANMNMVARNVKLEAVDRVVCGAYYTFFSTKKGWFATGDNRYGQLGFGRATKKVFTPVLLPHALENVRAGAVHAIARVRTSMPA